MRSPLREFRKRRHLTQEAIGLAIGYEGQSARQKIYRVEKGDEELTASQLAQLVDKFQVDPRELLPLSLDGKREGLYKSVYKDAGTEQPDADAIPIFAFVVDEAGETTKRAVGMTPRPPSLRAVRDAYAMYTPDDSMEPRYGVGWLLYVNPAKPAREGRDVVVYRKTGLPVVRHLERGASGRQRIVALAAEHEEAVAADETMTMHLIVGSDQEG